MSCRSILGQPREPESPIEQRHRNLASSLQARLEEVYLRLLRASADETQMKSAVWRAALRSICVANGKFWERRRSRVCTCIRAAGDAGSP